MDNENFNKLMRSSRWFNATTYTVEVKHIKAVDAENNSGKK